MLASQMVKDLQSVIDAEGDFHVHVSYQRGDYLRTIVIEPVTGISVEQLEWSEYHQAYVSVKLDEFGVAEDEEAPFGIVLCT